VRRERREGVLDRSVMLLPGAHEHTVPLPASGLGRLHEHQHLALVQIRREPAEHPLREESRAPGEGVEDPLVVERLQRSGSQISVFSPVGGTVRASFKYASTTGASAGSSPLWASQVPYSHL